MNNETAKLIEQLAQKLGTTTEYLWGILLRQAPLHATVTLIQVILIIVAGVILFKMHGRFSDDDNNISYYRADYIIAPMIIVVIIWLVLAIVAFFCLNDIINGYFNPEFWALDYILDSVKKSD